MMQTLFFNGKKLAFNDCGKGAALVLLHGYLETKEVWEPFAQALAEKYRVIVPDIPGHGQSETLAETHSMELMADALNAVLMQLHIKHATLIGHSMGGYVMLAFAHKYAETVQAMVLFHSSVYADTPEKKENRRREIELIAQGKRDVIVNTSLPKTFANANTSFFKNHLDAMMLQARNHATEGICALLRGMMERPDRQTLIRNFTKPLLFVFGENDNYIPVEAAKNMALLNAKAQMLWLKNSGHMGFVEEPETALSGIIRFLEAGNK